MVFFRALQILFVVLVSACVYVGGAVAAFVAIRDPIQRRRVIDRFKGRVTRIALVTLGATFVKLGQVMSTRLDLFPLAMIEELRKLQDQIPAFDFAAVRTTIETDLGAKIDERFAELDEVPVAAASVAQVHRGRLRDGTEVAVKVLRPGIRERALADGAVLRLGAKLLELSPTLALSKPLAHLEEFEEGIVAQTDLGVERANYELFRKNFDGDPDVTFPVVFSALCSPRVLTMTFLRGTKADALAPGDHVELATKLNRMFMKMVFEHGLLHADLHPGNFLIQDDGRVAVFDVGLAKLLPKARLDEFVDFSRCIAMGTTEELIEHTKTYHEYMHGTVDWDAFGRDVEAFVTTFRGMTKEEMELSFFFDTIFALGRKYRVRPVTDFTLIILGVMTAEGVGKMLDAKTDFMGNIAEFLMPLLANRVAELARIEEAAQLAAST